MKSGTGTDPFEEPREDDAREDVDAVDDRAADPEREFDHGASETTTTEAALPYIFDRERVTEQREQKGIWLQDETQAAVPNLVAHQDDRFDRDVQKTDVMEAAIVAATENPELVADVLERWGYGR